ncbi:heterokaryon incompatibility protein-domain-containing protein [Paraphoma chrysanthemicola]|nr:heterokaryon incompatibility protein-domain-containing protein [Paraphoma chrysanthemicola]
MRLLKSSHSGEFALESFRDDAIPPYAILSHTWTEGQEVDFQEITIGIGKDKPGYRKIQFCQDRATLDGLEYFWVDTCCIDKTSSQELSTAINSMFRWYQRSSKCYVYLSDVSFSEDINQKDSAPVPWELSFRESRWFTRGWTLQELLAPSSVEFFSRQGERLGNRVSLMQQIHEITNLPLSLFTGRKITDFTVEERLSWAANRETTLKEDRVYCLLGIFKVHLLPIYGEGEEYAQGRLKREIQQLQTPFAISTEVTREIGTFSGQTAARDLMEFERFLQWLSFPEMDFRYSDIDNVQDDTCKWLLNHAHYHQWQSGAESSPLLMIHGKPGSGKSTAMKRAFELAQRDAPVHTTVAACFFSSRGFPMQSKLEGFFRSMLHQLFRKHDYANNEVFREWQSKQKVVRSGWSWTVQELKWRFRQYVVQSASSLIMFVDALDECESTDAAHDLMDLVTDIRHSCGPAASKIQICISSRHYPNVGVLEPLHIIVETTNKDDISKFVEASLQSATSHVPTHELAKEISSHSEGMFLWAHLVLRKIRVALRDMETLTELYDIIHSTPKLLEEVFQELIDGISGNERARSNYLLSWILFARRPLHLSELDQAWAFRTAHSTYTLYETSRDFIRPEQMRLLLVKYTRGLAEAVEVKGLYQHTSTEPLFRVQFIHESVRQYILSRRHVITAELEEDWVDPGYVDHYMAQSCFNYLKAVCVENHVVEDIATQLDRRIYNYGMLCRLETKDRPFLEYALEYGLEHARLAELKGYPPSYLYDTTDGTHWWTAFTSLFMVYWRGRTSKRYGDAHKSKHWSECSTTQLAFASAYKLDAWIVHLLGSARSFNEIAQLSPALCVSAAFGNARSVASLIAAGADVDYESTGYGSALYLSLIHGHDHIVQILLEKGAAVDKGRRYYSPFIAAVSYRPFDTVTMLLEHGAVIAECGPRVDKEGYTLDKVNSLQAALRRDIKFLDVLLLHAETQKTSVEDYKAAYRSAWSPHATNLRSTVARLFPRETPISLWVSTFRGIKISVVCWADDLVVDVKERIYSREGLPVDQFWLSYRSRRLHEDRTLREYHVPDEAIVHMLLRARWGGNKVPGG